MRRRLLHLAIAATAVTVVAAALIHRAADARFATMSAWAEQAANEWEARDFTRQPLHGTAQPGSAFAHYQRATELIAALDPQTTAKARDLRLHKGSMPAAAKAELLQQFAPALQAMQQGAHCLDARPPMRWRDGFSHRVQNLLVARELVNAAVLSARAQCDGGEPAAAVPLLLDAATFASDLTSSPLLIDQMIGTALTAIATVEAWDDAALRQLPPAALQTLAAGMQRLDARLPVLCDFTGETLLFANTLLHAADQLDQYGLSLCSWRYGFSFRWAAAEAACFDIQLVAELAAHRDQPFAAREQLFAQVLARPQVQHNPVLAIALPNLTSCERNLRETSTLVRLLRCELAWRLGAPPLQLDDPLGQGRLTAREDGERMRFASAGRRAGKAIERLAPRS